MTEMNIDSFATRESTPTFQRVCQGAHQALAGWLHAQRLPSASQLAMLKLFHAEISQWQDRQPTEWNPVPHSVMTASLRLFLSQCEGSTPSKPPCPVTLQATRDYLRTFSPSV